MTPETVVCCEPWRQLEAAGYAGYVVACETTATTVRGTADARIVEALREDPRFQSGLGYGLHLDVGQFLADFRSFKGEFGPGSLQIVVDYVTGRFYADCDRFSPYEDLVGLAGHWFGEVIPNWFRRRLQKR